MDDRVINLLLEIKTTASGCCHRLQAIKAINDGINIHHYSVQILHYRRSIKLHIEYTIDCLQTLITLAQEACQELSARHTRLDDHRVSFMELNILGDRASRNIGSIQTDIESIAELAGVGEKLADESVPDVDEMVVRFGHVEAEIDELVRLTGILVA